MVQNNNDEDQAKLEAERKRLFDEAMASIHSMNKESEVARQISVEQVNKDSKEAKALFLSLLIAGLIISTLIYSGHPFVAIAVGFIFMIVCIVLFSSDDSLHGLINPAMTCPHCHQKGQVRTQSITQEKGVSGGKATAALLTGGLSLLAVGLSRKEGATQARCMNCNNTWTFN
jgi:DNA-directed RNA polymerase subunit M/transcription elongation factor TFIIS